MPKCLVYKLISNLVRCLEECLEKNLLRNCTVKHCYNSIQACDLMFHNIKHHRKQNTLNQQFHNQSKASTFPGKEILTQSVLTLFQDFQEHRHIMAAHLSTAYQSHWSQAFSGSFFRPLDRSRFSDFKKSLLGFQAFSSPSNGRFHATL